MYKQIKLVLDQEELQQLMDGEEIVMNVEFDWAADIDGNMMNTIDLDITLVKETTKEHE